MWFVFHQNSLYFTKSLILLDYQFSEHSSYEALLEHCCLHVKPKDWVPFRCPVENCFFQSASYQRAKKHVIKCIPEWEGIKSEPLFDLKQSLSNWQGLLIVCSREPEIIIVVPEHFEPAILHIIMSQNPKQIAA